MDPSPLRYVFGTFEVDTADKVLTQRGQPVPLTPKAFDTLLVLVQRHGRLVGKEDLLRLVWPDTFVEENNLAQNISALRRALGELATGDRYIETVPKRGYRFVAPVTEVGPAAAGVDARSAQPSSVRANAGAAPPATPDEDGTTPIAIGSGRSRARQVLPWAVGLAAAIVLVVIGVQAMRGRAGGVGTASAASAVTRIAVLPMVNLGPAADASFVAGLTEELTARLAGLRSVAVPSSTTLSAYDRRGKTLARIGADLGVNYIVEGSVRWTRDGTVARIRMNPRLVRVADDTTVWTQQFDASLSDLLGVQAEIARRITDALQVALDSREQASVAAHAAGDPEAYLAYLRGMAVFMQGTSDTANLAVARAELEQAVARDVRLAPAWSWLARVYAAQYRSGAARTPEVMDKGMRAAQTAIDLDPARADLRLGRIDMLMSARDLDGAQRELDTARASLPNSSLLLQRSAVLAETRGRWHDARAMLMQAFELDPASTAEMAAVHFLHVRDYDEARRFLGVGRAANQTGVLVPEAWAHFSDRGDLVAARRVLETARRMRTPADARVLALLARFEWYAGQPRRALQVIDEMDAAGSWLAPNFRFPAALAAAQVYDSMGRRDDATRLYTSAYAQLKRHLAAHPQEVRVESALALAAAGLGRKDEALARAGRAAVEARVGSADLPLHLYLQAQVQVRVGDHAAAMATLDQLFGRVGFYSDAWVRHDPMFASLRRQPELAAALPRWATQRGLDRLASPRSAPGHLPATKAGQ
jgi:DNA-binding winged helix-turn-helix (wHTH) protein/TolB-like protein/Tfp pilus assembly protein PilF